MNRFIRKSLEAGEEIIFNGRLHWTSVAGTVLLGWTLMVAGVVAVIQGLAPAGESAAAVQPVEAAAPVPAETSAYGPLFYVGVALALVGLCVRLWAWLSRTRTEFAVTPRRLIQKDGILSVKLTEIPLHKVESVELTQSLPDRLLGTGSVRLVGSGGTMHTLERICDPMALRSAVARHISEPPAAPAAPAAESPSPEA